MSVYILIMYTYSTYGIAIFNHHPRTQKLYTKNTKWSVRRMHRPASDDVSTVVII